MQLILKIKVLATSIIALVMLGATPAPAAEPGLAVLMQRLQTYTHKLQLSVEARNGLLADFYLHEIEETAEDIADNIKSYDDKPIGDLTREMLLPAVERLEDAVKGGDWGQGDARFVELLRTCNACHAATGHAAIRIAPARGNPFAQEFGVVED